MSYLDNGLISCEASFILSTHYYDEYEIQRARVLRKIQSEPFFLKFYFSFQFLNWVCHSEETNINQFSATHKWNIYNIDII